MWPKLRMNHMHDAYNLTHNSADGHPAQSKNESDLKSDTS